MVQYIANSLQNIINMWFPGQMLIYKNTEIVITSYGGKGLTINRNCHTSTPQLLPGTD